MALLIDGYNLLHVTGIYGTGERPGSLQGSREALLRFLAASIDARERSQTTIVFDAAEAPPGLPRTVSQNDMTIRYATGYPDADTLIEELIDDHDAPRGLLVVSSDRRIQRAARRRRASFVESDRWYSELWQHRLQRRVGKQLRIPEKPMNKLTASEIDYWINEFDLDESYEEIHSDEALAPPEQDTTQEDSDNPFPPGYGEDLL